MDESVSVTYQDLLSVLQIIQLCTTRGAFRAEELSAIGTLYDKITKFLEATKEQQQQTTTVDTPPTQ